MIIALLAALLLGSGTGYAADFRSPRIAALGGAGHAGPVLNDAIYLNPSFVSFLPVLALSASYSLFNGDNYQTPLGLSGFYGNNWNVSAQDGSQGALFQAGLGVTKREDALMIHVGAAKKAIDRLGFGLSGKVILPNDGSRERLIDSTFSMTGVPFGWFQTSLLVDNILETAASRGFYREVTLGTKFNVIGIVLAYVDPHWTPSLPAGSNFGVEAGLEFPIMKDFFLRGGAFRNSLISFENRYGDGYGAGAGWIGPKIIVDYGFTVVSQPIPAWNHTFGLSFYL